MKKLVTIFALFTLVMLTSFVEPSDIGGLRTNGDRGTVNTGNFEIGGGGSGERGKVGTGN